MNILFIHQNFPGQFRHLAVSLAKNKSYKLLAVAKETAPGLNGIRVIRYKPSRRPSAQTHHYIKNLEDAVLHGQQVMRLLLSLKSRGYFPDVIIAHPGWGESLYVKDVYPNVRLIHFCEYYYHAVGADLGCDPEFPVTLDQIAGVRTRNALSLMNLENCDMGVTPTQWQYSLHPEAYRNKIKVLHEGIDIENLTPDPAAQIVLKNVGLLRAGDPIVTYVARNLEPYRGFHKFMRALPKILANYPTCRVLVVGGDEVSYGTKPRDASNWREKMLRENPVDQSRVHFTGKISYSAYKKVLQVSAVHLYMTYPFVLSWSMLEAMASGGLVIGSNTAPVREVIKHNHNGLLVEFDEESLAECVVDTLLNRKSLLRIREQARHDAGEFCSKKSVKLFCDHFLS